MPEHAQPSYTRLPSSPSHQDDLEHLVVDPDYVPEKGRIDERSAGYLSEAFCWRLFVAACIVSLAVSAVNMTALSIWTTTRVLHLSSLAHDSTTGLKRPSPYLGLENVAVDPSYCRSRATFPETFYTFDTRDAPRTRLRHVHAPDDKTTLNFGGPIRAVADVYVPDHGLENCTLNLRRMHEHGSADSSLGAVDIEVYLRPTADPADSGPVTFLDTLGFAPGTESNSRPFHCPSRSHIVFEWRCRAKDCQVSLPLAGVTRMTSSPASLSKSSFRITQYEALHCISE